MGQRLRVLREHFRLSRAELSNATGVDASALARLEHGGDVRISTYLAVVDCFLERAPEAWMLADRIVALGDERRAKANDHIQWLARTATPGDEHD
ncbi:helix-turn-helix transcriptional regulator [Enhygromyxa salina]|uniref:helix-turn-helix domain-containing protein n=1 Tax=Enhygromyxa salina TaxID=215803 RepID=UPI0004E67534